jgi:hypothetical protein
MAAELQLFHNQHLSVEENPHGIVPTCHQQQFSIHIWFSTIAHRLLRPYALPAHLPQQNNVAFLENHLPLFQEVSH